MFCGCGRKKKRKKGEDDDDFYSKKPAASPDQGSTSPGRLVDMFRKDAVSPVTSEKIHLLQVSGSSTDGGTQGSEDNPAGKRPAGEGYREQIRDADIHGDQKDSRPESVYNNDELTRCRNVVHYEARTKITKLSEKVVTTTTEKVKKSDSSVSETLKHIDTGAGTVESVPSSPGKVICNYAVFPQSVTHMLCYF